MRFAVAGLVVMLSGLAGCRDKHLDVERANLVDDMAAVRAKCAALDVVPPRSAADALARSRAQGQCGDEQRAIEKRIAAIDDVQEPPEMTEREIIKATSEARSERSREMRRRQTEQVQRDLASIEAEAKPR